eukprot:6178219-Pleurochrysis_carterae.AAC.6
MVKLSAEALKHALSSFDVQDKSSLIRANPVDEISSRDDFSRGWPRYRSGSLAILTSASRP